MKPSLFNKKFAVIPCKEIIGKFYGQFQKSAMPHFAEKKSGKYSKYFVKDFLQYGAIKIEQNLYIFNIAQSEKFRITIS